MKYRFLILLYLGLLAQSNADETKWQLIDDFEASNLSEKWRLVDPDNQTTPYIDNPQVTLIKGDKDNHYLLKKPANEGIVGNRKALTFRLLPTIVGVGEVYTFFTRINVEYFPNNHSFGLSNLTDEGIINNNYDAFEPMLRVTDKAESDGSQNNGTLMVSTGFKQYARITHPLTGQEAMPLKEGVWYSLWYVVNNAKSNDGGQSFDLYIRGGEFAQQTLVYQGARFRMGREQPLKQFFMISNTGSKRDPYGNGGVLYDDLYMAEGTILSYPKRH
jgi:hypothetical protein